MISLRNNINSLNSYLLISLFFLLPFSRAAGTILSFTILAGWLLSCDFKNDFNKLKNNPVLLSIILFISLNIIGFLWTDDINNGLYTLKRLWRLLMIPIFMLYVKKEHIPYYISSFILAMSISELLSYGVWFEIIPPFLKATVHEPIPFYTHLTYNPFLTIAIYLLSTTLLFNKNISPIKRTLYSIFLVTMTINMFITGGRSGQVMFFFAILILNFQYFQGKIIKASIISVTLIIGVFTLAYSTSHIFHTRVNNAVHAINYHDNKNISSTGLRMTFNINSFEVFLNHPLIGVGTGDFITEYKKINEKNSPTIRIPSDPHSMYLIEMVQFGIPGLLSLIFIFYTQIRHALSNQDKLLSKIGFTLPTLYFIINFSGAYLQNSETSLIFALFSSFLYKNYTEKTTPNLYT